jgi:hypothetical protein
LSLKPRRIPAQPTSSIAQDCKEAAECSAHELWPFAAPSCRAAIILALCLTTAETARAQTPAPELRFESAGTARGAEARLGRVDEEQLGTIVRLLGLENPGAPIRVVLAAEDSEIARSTPSWIAGFAHSATDTVVLFPSRSIRYPHDSLEAVLRHEVAHILIARAANGQPLPRWFNEGLSMAAERTWHFGDRRQLAWALVTGAPIQMDRVDALFHQGPSEAAAAYSLAGAFVRHVIDVYGPDAPGRILRTVADGEHFANAFLRTTGKSLSEAEREFHADLISWQRWIPLLTSPFVLWGFVALLALYAVRVRRRRRAERYRQWAEEEESLNHPPPST